MISNETKELLEGFEKRMRFVNIVKYIKKHSFTDEIKEFFPGDQDSMDNLVLMVLVFIMDSTLRYGEKCKKSDISRFIYELSEVYDYPAEKSDVLTEFIVTDVLRYSGRIVEFNTFDSNCERFMPQSTIMLNDINGNFNLSDEVYEFLFRTKEIDSELDFSVSRFKLNEFIKRGNYSKALRESRELVSRVRNLITQMDTFILRCKVNISDVAIDEYEEIFKKVKSAFDDESQQLNDIRNLVSAKLQAIVDSYGERKGFSDSEETEKEINEILSNIDVVIEEQTRIYNKKFSLSECYSELIDNDLMNTLSERFDFEDTILKPMRLLESDEDTLANLSKLFIPLLKPELPRYFSIESFYEKHKKIPDEHDISTIDIDAEETGESIETVRNDRYLNIINSLFEYMHNNKVIFSQYLDALSEEELTQMNSENALLDVMLKLYSIGSIDISGWKSAEKSIVVPSGEFDLSYCLSELSDELLDMKTINILRLDNIYELTIENQAKIFINDFEFEVIR